MRGVIASGTLGGNVPRRCFVCRRWVWVEPSEPVGDAPCPCCGSLLWPWHGRTAARARRRVGARSQSNLRRVLRRALAACWPGRRRKAAAAAAPPSPAGAGGVWDPWLDA